MTIQSSFQLPLSRADGPTAFALMIDPAPRPSPDFQSLSLNGA